LFKASEAISYDWTNVFRCTWYYFKRLPLLVTDEAPNLTFMWPWLWPGLCRIYCWCSTSLHIWAYLKALIFVKIVQAI